MDRDMRHETKDKVSRGPSPKLPTNTARDMSRSARSTFCPIHRHPTSLRAAANLQQPPSPALPPTWPPTCLRHRLLSTFAPTNLLLHTCTPLLSRPAIDTATSLLCSRVHWQCHGAPRKQCHSPSQFFFPSLRLIGPTMSHSIRPYMSNIGWRFTLPTTTSSKMSLDTSCRSVR